MSMLRDPLAGRSVGPPLQTLALIVGAFAWAFSVYLTLTGPAYYPTWFTAAALPAIGLPLLIGLVVRRDDRRRLLALRGYLVAVLIVRVVGVFFERTPAGTVDYSSLIHTVNAALFMLGIAFRPEVGMPVAGVMACCSHYVRVAPVGTVQATAETVINIGAAMVSFLVVNRLNHELNRLEDVTRAAHRERVRAAAADARVRVRERWDGIVHDKVLAALTLASRGRVADAAGLAVDALTALASNASDPDRPSGSDALDAVRQHAHSVGVELTLQVDRWPPDEIGEVLEAAVCEALTNVARHSGVRAATVQLARENERWRVTVADRGHGFDTAAVSGRRLGLRQRIVAAVESVGGQVSVESGAAGTRLTMWAPVVARVTTASADEPTWTARAFVALAGICALLLGGHLGIGGIYFHDGRWLTVTIAGMMLLPAVTVLVTLLAVGRLSWWATLVVLVATYVALAANVVNPEVPDWRWWFVGAFDTAVALIGARAGMRVALVTVGSALLLSMAVLVVRGAATVLPLLLAGFQTVGWVGAGGGFKAILDRASVRIGQEARTRADAQARALAAGARDDELRRRQVSLNDEVVPALGRIATGTVLSDAERRRCAELEAATRDQLVAGSILTPDLVELIGQARRRGATVAVLGRADGSADLRALHEAGAILLRAARPGDRVQLTWRPDERGRLAVASLVGPGVGLGAVPAELVHLDRAATQVSVDDDAVLVELLARRPDHASAGR